MKRSLNFFFYFFLLLNISVAQVGIGTAAPAADLEVVSKSILAPGEFNGIIIPRVSSFPSAPAPVAPAGTIIYLTTTVGSNLPGFYFSNGSSYINVTDAAMGTPAFYNSGTTNNADNTTGTIFRSGRTSMGVDNPVGILNVEIPAVNSTGTSTPINVRNLSTANINSYGASLNNSSLTTALKIGLDVSISTVGNGNHYGIRNNVFLPNSVNKVHYGIFNNVGTTTTVSSTSYGIFSEVGGISSRGIKYGVYSHVINDGTENAYSGYFRGDHFSIRSEDDSDGYEMPTVDGTAGQSLTTNGAGVASWSSPNAAGVFKAIRTIATGTVLATDHTLIVSGNISIPDAVAGNLGQIYKLVLANGTTGHTITALGADFLRPNGTGAVSTLDLLNGAVRNSSYTIQSDGNNWYVIDTITN